MWEVDWTNKDNTGTIVWARNPTGHIPSSRDWHWVSTGHLRKCGINTPTYRRDAWEIDWTKRSGKSVWARNTQSKMPSARDWHWIDHKTVDVAGLQWKPAKSGSGRSISGGYVRLTRRGMSTKELNIAEHYDLFRGNRKTYVLEHQLVAAAKYDGISPGAVVRHLNGIKDDNRPENLVLGSSIENNMDHDKARLSSIYWHGIAIEQTKTIEKLKKHIAELEDALNAVIIKSQPEGSTA